MALTKVTGQVIKNTTDVTVGVLTVTNTLAVGGTVSIGGTLTYEDVTNVDAVGLITARNGIVVGSGITLSKDGDGFFTGVTTATTFVGALTGNVTGNISGGTVAGSTGTFTGNVAVSGANITLQDSGSASDDRIALGAGGDLQLFHDGSNSYVRETGTGSLFLEGNSTIYIGKASGGAENGIVYNVDGSVDLYHNNAKKLETTADGIEVTGKIFPSSHIDMADNVQLLIGTGDDLTIQHDGSNTRIKNDTGQLQLRSNAIVFENAAGSSFADIQSHFRMIDNKKIYFGSATDAEIYHDTADTYFKNSTGTLYLRSDTISLNALSTTDTYLSCTNGGAVSLRHDNTEVLTTHADGIVVTNYVKFAGTSCGIDFGSTANTAGMTSEVLDDYEEGTFTPTVIFDSTNNHTYSEQQGIFTKIGNYVQGVIVLTFDDQASSGQCKIGNLPFTSSNDTASRIGGYFNYQDGLSIPSGQGSNQLILYGGSNTNVVGVYFVGGTNNSELGPGGTELTSSHTGTNNTLRAVFHYRTA